MSSKYLLFSGCVLKPMVSGRQSLLHSFRGCCRGNHLW